MTASNFDWYDILLFIIPTALIASLVVHAIAGVSPTATIVPASLVGLLAIGDAVFLHPPTRGNRGAV